jgi:hypothetical protein
MNGTAGTQQAKPRNSCGGAVQALAAIGFDTGPRATSGGSDIKSKSTESHFFGWTGL